MARRIAFAVLRPFAIFVPVFLFGTFITFLLGVVSGLNPAYVQLGDAATPAAVARLDHLYGLDRPFLVQYWSWLWNALHGNLGVSYFTQIPVSTSIAQRLPVDLSIALIAVVIALVVGFTSGILAARFRGRFIDKAVTALASLFITDV